MKLNDHLQVFKCPVGQSERKEEKRYNILNGYHIYTPSQDQYGQSYWHKLWQSRSKWNANQSRRHSEPPPKTPYLAFLRVVYRRAKRSNTLMSARIFKRSGMWVISILMRLISYWYHTRRDAWNTLKHFLPNLFWLFPWYIVDRVLQSWRNPCICDVANTWIGVQLLCNCVPRHWQ